MIRRTRLTLHLIAALLFCPLLGGCWDRQEVNDLALVTGVAIDQRDDRYIEVSIQIFIPQGSTQGTQTSSGGAAGRAGTTFVQSAYGENIADALSQLQMKFSRPSARRHEGSRTGLCCSRSLHVIVCDGMHRDLPAGWKTAIGCGFCGIPAQSR